MSELKIEITSEEEVDPVLWGILLMELNKKLMGTAFQVYLESNEKTNQCLAKPSEN